MSGGRVKMFERLNHMKRPLRTRASADAQTWDFIPGYDESSRWDGERTA